MIEIEDMMALVFLFPKGQSPSFGIRFDTKEEAEATNYIWHNIIADWQCKIEIEGVRIKLTVWLPNTQHKHKYIVYEWNRNELNKFLNECKKITQVEFYHWINENKALVSLRITVNKFWKINVRKIEVIDLVPKNNIRT